MKKRGCPQDQESAWQKWERLGNKWKKRFLIKEDHPELGSWLDAVVSDKHVAVGCRVCKRAGRDCSRFATYEVNTADALQVVNFCKHEGSPRHQAAVEMYLSGRGGNVDAPSVDEYEALCKEILDGSATCNPLKKAKMTWTLSEAFKSQDQLAVEKCDSMAMFRDESKSRLLLRFRAISPSLDEHPGFLGQESDFGTGALNITKATANVMKRFSSRFSGAPGKRRVGCFVKKHTLKNMRRAIRVLTVDAAGDEVLSGEMMRSATLAGTQRRLTPNLQFLNRDKTHGSRRIISRGWSADPFLRDVVQMLARGRGSMARIVQNSDAIRTQYKIFCQTSFRSIHNTVKNMRAAPHRYDSIQKPLGRSVLFIVPLIKTAAWLVHNRSDAASVRAKDWLNWVDDERCLQASMQADASDQVMMLTRVLDDENADPAVINREVATTIATLDRLFGDEKHCLRIFGYTKTMLRTLRRIIVWHVGNVTRSLGSHAGVADDIVDRCLQRMRCWLTLLKATCAAEFPIFEIMQATDIYIYMYLYSYIYMYTIIWSLS